MICNLLVLQGNSVNDFIDFSFCLVYYILFDIIISMV